MSVRALEAGLRAKGLFAVALGDAVGVAGEGACVAADADRRADRALRGRRSIALENPAADRATSTGLSLFGSSSALSSNNNAFDQTNLGLDGHHRFHGNSAPTVQSAVALVDQVGVDRGRVRRSAKSEGAAVGALVTGTILDPLKNALCEAPHNSTVILQTSPLASQISRRFQLGSSATCRGVGLATKNAPSRRRLQSAKAMSARRE